MSINCHNNNEIAIINVLPSYQCNLSCPHCLSSHKRLSGTLKAGVLRKTLKILKSEDRGMMPHFEWYGGEVGILPDGVLDELLDTVSAEFPCSTHSVVSSLSTKGVFKSIKRVANRLTHVCTSFDGLRFEGNKAMQAEWQEYVVALAGLKPVDCITAAHKGIQKEVFSVINSLPFRYLTILKLMVPEDMPKSMKEKLLLEHSLNIKDYFGVLKMAEGIIDKARLTHTFLLDISIRNVLHIFPDGSVGLPAPSRLGFPLASTVVFFTPKGKQKMGENSIIYNPTRVNYVISQSMPCKPSCRDISRCNTEIKYQGVCTAYLQHTY